MSIKAMKQTLSEVKALATFIGRYDPPSIPNLFTKRLNALADHLSQAIAEAENQEPVAECVDDGEGGVYYKTLALNPPIGLLYTQPQPKREPLTDEQAKDLLKRSDLLDMFENIGWYSAPKKGFNEHGLSLIRAVEAAHGIKEDA